MELRQQTAAKTDSTHHGVFETALTKPLESRQRNYFLRIIAQCEMQYISVVHRNIQNDTSSRLGFVESPSLQPGRKINRVKDTCCQRLADRPLPNQFAEGTMSHRIPKMMVRAQHHPRPPAGFEHLT